MKARSFWPLALGYVALRILLTVVIAAVVFFAAQLGGLDMPIQVAAMLAVIVQLPLAWLVLGGLRRRLTAQLAASAGERRQLRGELRAALSDGRTYSEDRTEFGGTTDLEDRRELEDPASVDPAPDEATRP